MDGRRRAPHHPAAGALYEECMIISSHGSSRLGAGHAHGAPSPAGVDIETETATETETEQRDATPAVRRTCVHVCVCVYVCGVPCVVCGVEHVCRDELQLRSCAEGCLFPLRLRGCGPASFGVRGCLDRIGPSFACPVIGTRSLSPVPLEWTAAAAPRPT